MEVFMAMERSVVRLLVGLASESVEVQGHLAGKFEALVPWLSMFGEVGLASQMLESQMDS
jgi:hypothetical protein